MRSTDTQERPGASRHIFEQVVMMTIISNEDFTTQMPFTKRTHYSGTNLGNKIGDVVLDSLDSLWKLKVEDKIALHGRFRIDCGGKTKGEVDPPGRGVKRQSVKDEEPVFFHRTYRISEKKIFVKKEMEINICNSVEIRIVYILKN